MSVRALYHFEGGGTDSTTLAALGAGSARALYHFDGAGTDSAVLGAAVIAPNDANIIYSPYGWDVTAQRALTVNAGAYGRVFITGSTSFKLLFNLSATMAPYPHVAYRIDGGAWTFQEMDTEIQIPVPATNTWSKHLIEWVFVSETESTNRWYAPFATAVNFKGIAVTAGAVTAPATPRKLTGIIFGDSITEGLRTRMLANQSDTDNNDATLGWAWRLGEMLGAEVCVVGFSAQGWNRPGYGNVPVFTSTWNYLYDTKPRTIITAPDFVLINHGTNDQTDPTSYVTSTVNAMLTAYPVTTKIILMRPIGGNWAAQLQAAVATINSNRVSYLDTTGWWSSTDSPDGTHPSGFANLTQIAPRAAAGVRNVLGQSNIWVKKADGSLKSIGPARK